MDTLALRPSGPASSHASRRLLRRLGAPLALLLTAVVALIAPQACAACSCIVMTFSEAADQAEVVFVGTVTGPGEAKETELGAAIDYTFSVSEVYKGSAPAQAVVRTADNSAACGFNFDEGETYLVMARSGPDGLETDLCSGTALAGEVAQQDLDSLGPPTAPGASPPSGDADPAASASEPGRLWFILGGVTLGALLTGFVLWWQRRRPADDPAGTEIRRPSPGEALPHTEAT